MARAREPEKGERHNMLTFLEPAGREPAGTMGGRVLYAPLGRWLCDCGREIVCRNRYVLRGSKKSCGCLLRAKGEAWHKARAKPAPRPDHPMHDLADALRYLADTLKSLGEMRHED